MKKEILILLVSLVSLVAMSSFKSTNKETDKSEKIGYYYCTFQGDGLVHYYTSVFTADWDEYETGIKNDVHDSIKIKYKKTYYNFGRIFVWGPYKSYSEASKKKKTKMANEDKDWTIRSFNYSYSSN